MMRLSNGKRISMISRFDTDTLSKFQTDERTDSPT